MLSFTDSYTLWRHLPFPSGGPGEGLALTRSDLSEADEYVTTVIRYVERGIFKPAPVDVLEMLQALMHRIDRLGSVATGGEQAAARSQHAYAERPNRGRTTERPDKEDLSRCAALLHLVYRQFLEDGRPRE